MRYAHRGEPTLQFPAVNELLAGLSGLGIHTAMETNGACEKLPLLFPSVNQLIMDFKHYDSAVHKTFTGMGNETVIRTS
jgi:pyruvate formate lyase activating enzyme